MDKTRAAGRTFWLEPPGKPLFLAELGSCSEALRAYWPLVLSIGFLFGWLLSFPLQGPLLAIPAQNLQIDPQRQVVLFLIGHVAGLAGAGVAGHFWQKQLRWFSLAAIPCTAISLLLAGATPPRSPLLFAALGLRPPNRQAPDRTSPSREAPNRLSSLTRREHEVARLLVTGTSTEDILERLVVAPDTLKSHVLSIYRKAGVRNRLELVIMPRDSGDQAASDHIDGLPSGQTD